MSEDVLYQKYRPKRFSDMIGQNEAVSVLSSLLKKDKLPHCLLITGPSGTGKTTAARILGSKLDCRHFIETDCAGDGGIDRIRYLKRKIPISVPGGGCRILYFDEAHKLTNDAQNSLLKITEDTPKHIYIFLA